MKTKSNLTRQERETVISFNEAEPIAHIFTHNKVWQRHLEDKLKLIPVMCNGLGGKEYEIPKDRVRPPQAKKKLSSSEMARLSQGINRNRVLSAKSHAVA